MPELKPAYLIHGDDHGAVAERRASLRALAERMFAGLAGVEVLEPDQATPAGVAYALSAMTLSLGALDSAGAGRVIIVDGVERWREGDVERDLAPAMRGIEPGTTIALIAREEGRTLAPPALHEAVRKAGGQIIVHATVKPWELAGWAREQAGRLGLELDAAGAKALVAQVGERQQRLLRELEKLALDDEINGRVDAEAVERWASHSAEWRAFELADALVAANAGEALGCYLRLRGQGERTTGLTYVVAQRLRDALAVAVRLADGEPAAEIKRSLRMPSRAADRLLREVRGRDPDELRRALRVIAELEIDTRGGAPITASRGATASLSEDTLTVRALEAIAGSAS